MPLAIMFLLAVVSPLVSRLGHGLWTAWLVFPVWALYVAIEKPSDIRRIAEEIRCRRGEIIFLLGWLAVVAANTVFFKRGYAGWFHLQTMVTLLMTYALELVYSSRRDGSYRLVSRAFLLFMAIEAIRSLPVLLSRPEMARALTAGQADSSTLHQMALLGVGDYNLYTGLAVVLPVVLSLSVEACTGPGRVSMALAAIGFACAIALSMFMGASLLAMAGSIGFGWLAYKRTPRKLKAVRISILVLCGAAAVWMLLLSKIPQALYVIQKFQRYRISHLGVEEAQLRLKLYSMSLQTFIGNPLFGVGAGSGMQTPFYGTLIGGHSSWLDMLAEYGLFGFFFYGAFLISAIRRVFQNSRSGMPGWPAAARRISCVLFVLGGIYNPVITSTVIVVLFHFLVTASSEDDPWRAV